MIKTLRLSLLSLFAVLCGTMFADTYTHEFVKDEITASGTVTLSDVDWDISTCSYFGWDNQNGKGFQFGSGSKPCTTLKVSTNGIEGTITEIKVTTSGANSIVGTLDVTVGGAAFGEQYTLTNASTEVTFTGSASGEIALNYAQTSSKAIYIKSIAVTYTTQPQPAANYYVVGNMTDWGVNDAYKMTLNEKAEVEEYVYSMALTTASQFKVVKQDGSNQTWYPDGMGNNYGEKGEITADGNYKISFRPNGQDGWFYNYIKVEAYAESALMAEAKELANDADAVAVGKLRAAIATAEATGDETELQAAVDQFKADNADQEKDETAKVATNGWKKFEGNDAAGVCATQFAPAITTYDGRNAQLAEVYETTVNTTGQIIYQNITGLTNGKYKVGFYGNAFFTSGRGFTSEMEDGAEDVAYVFANNEKEFITARIATSTTENNFRQFDVEVTDGTIKLGMGKEKAGTNWHTMQIYQLTWFTTAKEVYAALKEEMTTAIATAKALTGETGVDEFSAAITDAETALGSNMLNIIEFTAEIAKLNEAIKTFKIANAPVPNGKYYVMAAAFEDNNLMAAGKSWGTRGIINGNGLDLALEYNADKDAYTIETNIYNGNNHFLGSDLFMDAPAFDWTIEGDFVYTISATFEGVKKYIGVSTDGSLALKEEATDDCYWAFLNADFWEGYVKEAGLEAMELASEKNPVDATFLLKDANFNRNDHRWAAWTVAEGCTNKNLGGGCSQDSGNGCAESYHSTITISQAIEGAPAGLYKLTAQGFYRQDGDAEETVPVFFVNDSTAQIPVKTGDENSMTAAGISFENGLYAIEPIEFLYDGESEFVVGVKNETATNQWIIWDNFQLTYYGDPANPAPELVEVPTSATIENDWSLEGVSFDGEDEYLEQHAVKVAFDGDDIYVQGLAYFFPEAWVKGTIANGKATFATGQYVGVDEYGKEFIIGIDTLGNAVDFVFAYDAENHRLTLDPDCCYAENETKDDVDPFLYWYDIEIFKGEIATPEVVTVPAGLKTEDYTFKFFKYVPAQKEGAQGSFEEGSADIKIGFNGNDVYVQGVSYNLPEAWVKGTIANGKATFATGQYFGFVTDDGYNYDMFFTGVDLTASEIKDVEMTYNAETGKFESEDIIIVNAYEKKIIYDYESYFMPVFEKKVADGINEVNTQNEKMVIYNLNGQKLEKAQKGLNIINGKVMIRK